MAFNISSKKVDLNDENYINKLSKSALKLISESNTAHYILGERGPEIIIPKTSGNKNIISLTLYTINV